MAFVAIYDANVLYPSTLRDVLIRIAQSGLVQAKWTDQILDETFRNLLKDRPDIPPEKLDRVRALMNAAIRAPAGTEQKGAPGRLTGSGRSSHFVARHLEVCRTAASCAPGFPGISAGRVTRDVKRQEAASVGYSPIGLT